MLIRRSFSVVLIAAVVASVGVVPASAVSPDAVAIVVDEQGDIVLEIFDRADVFAALGRARAAAPGEELTLEYLYRASGTIKAPSDDPLLTEQWHLDRTGTPDIWGHTDGEGVTVAVLDSTVNIADSAQDGFCGQIVSPYDAIGRRPGLPAFDRASELSHGTHVAGTIAQCTDNGVGGAGVAPGASVMPVRVLDDDGVGVTSDLVAGIDWAVSHGADVINMSLGSRCFLSRWPSCGDPKVDEAIRDAFVAGVVMVAAAGNSRSRYVAYPSNHPYTISVGATNQDSRLWSDDATVGSNFGAKVDLLAPGADIIQETTSYGSFGYFATSGTSMAAPQVSATVALMLSVDPTLSPADVELVFRDTASEDPFPDWWSAWGFLQVFAAVYSLIPNLSPGDACIVAPCDTVASVDRGGLWGIEDQLFPLAPSTEFFYGIPGDYPFMGDWDGDGIATPGLYRQSDGFVYLRHSNTQGNADVTFFFGDPGDVPLVGDWDGDGDDTVSIWRPSEARVFIINELGADGGGLGAADFDFLFGNPGDEPFAGDFDGDGIDTVGLYRESTGFAYLRNELATGNADLEFYYGDPGDQILAGDWDGDGDDSVAVYRPSNGIFYANYENAPGPADWTGYLGGYPSIVTAGRK